MSTIGRFTFAVGIPMEPRIRSNPDSVFRSGLRQRHRIYFFGCFFQKSGSSGKDAVQLPYPSYPQQRHRFSIYETGPHSSPVCFAAAELPNGVLGFYIPA